MGNFKLRNEGLDVTSTILPLFYVSTVFGMMPLSVSVIFSQPSSKAAFISFLPTLCHLSLILWGVYPTATKALLQINQTDNDLVFAYSAVFREFSGVFLSILSLLLAMKHRNKIIEFIRGFISVDSEMKRINIALNYKKMRQTLCVWLTVICAPVIVVVLLALFYLKPDGTLIGRFYWMSAISAFCINKITVVCIVSYMYMIYLRFHVTNKHIKNVIILKNTNAEFGKSEVYVAMPHHRTVLKGTLDRDQIPALCSIHDKLCELAKLVNGVYSLQILLTIGVAFTVLVVHLYVIYLLHNSGENLEKDFPLKLTTMWGVLFSVDVISISHISSKTKEEANSTGLLLRKALNKISAVEIRTKVDMLSLQLCHQRVGFTACGFFPVDLSLVYMLVGAVTTYLVFLIQFEMAFRKQ